MFQSVEEDPVQNLVLLSIDTFSLTEQPLDNVAVAVNENEGDCNCAKLGLIYTVLAVEPSTYGTVAAGSVYASIVEVLPDHVNDDVKGLVPKNCTLSIATPSHQ